MKASLSVARHIDRQRVIALREALIDCDIVVDDCRRDLDRMAQELRAAVARRDAIAKELADLVQAT